jgi:predicted  nucleic acid-binding Zn-ribbon protein
VVEALDANGVNIPETLKNISDKLEELSVKLEAANTTLDSLANLTGATRNLLYASGTLVGDMSLAVGYTQELADTMQYNMQVNGATLRDNIATLADALMTTNANLGGFSEDLNRMLNEDGALDTFTKETIQSRKETAQQLQQNAEEMARISRERGLNGLASQMELAAQGFGNIAQRMENMQQEDPANPDSWTAQREELQAVLTDVGGVKSALSGAAAEVVEALGMDLEEDETSMPTRLFQ